MKFNKYIAIILVIIIFGGIAFFLWTSGGSNQADTSPTPTIHPSSVPSDWQTFTSEEHNFTINHPSAIKIEERSREAVRFIKLGPTQRENTELYDGISLTFNSGQLDGLNLENLVQKKIQEAHDEPINEVISSIEPVSIADLEGYQYRVRGLGEFTHIFLPKGQDGYLHIINGTVDPTNQGFTRTVNSMFSTLKIQSSGTQTTIILYFIDLEDNGKMGQRIGCNDSLVEVERQVQATHSPLTAALEELLKSKERIVGQSELYNALHQSDLQIESSSIKNNTATIKLTGNLVLGGVCDNPRAEAQLKQTALQFPAINTVEIFINNRPLNDVLSGR